MKEGVSLYNKLLSETFVCIILTSPEGSVDFINV